MPKICLVFEFTIPHLASSFAKFILQENPQFEVTILHDTIVCVAENDLDLWKDFLVNAERAFSAGYNTGHLAGYKSGKMS